MGKIGIYGGSFNPVHNGHVLAAREFVRIVGLDRLLVIPAGIPPHKVPDGTVADGFVRAELLRLAMAQIPQAVVDETELHRAGKSYTVDTLYSVRERFPDDEIYLLMGTDMFLSFLTWNRFDEILRLAALVVFRRDAYSCFDSRLCALADELKRDHGAKILFPDNSFAEISSTLVRRMLFFGCGSQYIPAAVFHRIEELGLYGVGEDLKGLSLDELKNAVMPLYDKRRFGHAVGCSETAVKLAGFYGADPVEAARAGMLHDITKSLSEREQLRLCEKYGIITDDYGGDQIKLLHGKTAAAAARHIFDENAAVCESISWHTTGRADMTLLEKIIYLADYIEPNRDFDGVEQLRELAYSDLDAAVLKGLQMTIDHVIERNRTLNRHSVEARDYLALKGK